MESLGGTGSRPGARALFANLILERSLIDAVNRGAVEGQFGAQDNPADAGRRGVVLIVVLTAHRKADARPVESNC